MKIILFSKNRAMQIETLLRSLPKETICVVIYLANSQLHKAGYDKLIKNNNNLNVTFIKETIIKLNVLRQLVDLHNCLISFMVDDIIIYDNNLPDIVLTANECYSLRLHPCIKNPIHFNYTMSLDGNVYRQKDILPLIDLIEFNNPNQLESALQGNYGHNFKMKYGKGYLIGFNHNRVSDTSHCAFTNDFSEDKLNQMFLDGFIIDYEAMNLKPINNVHTSQKYIFKKAE